MRRIVLSTPIDRKRLLKLLLLCCFEYGRVCSMKKTPGYKLLNPAERRRLSRELKQMWRTVPPEFLARARELAGVQPGKEHEFRTALVKEEEGAYFMGHEVPINVRVRLVDGVVKGQSAKLLKVLLNCGERAWQIEDGVYAKRFQSSDHLQKFLASVENHVQLHLLERLRDTCIHVWNEAVAKASNEHGVRKIDLTALADAYAKELRRDKSKALSIPRGRRKGSKQSKVRLSKRHVEVDLLQFIRDNGSDTTRKQAAAWLRLNNEKALDRALAPYGGWRKLKAEAIGKIKKEH